MPTENRSSNTEMVSVPREEIEAACARFAKAQIFDFSRRVRAWLDKPAQHIHPEPIAWMVGTAFWWTKEEAERDAAATGLPIVGLGPMTDTAEVERLRDGISRHWKVVCDQRSELDMTRKQLAETVAVLSSVKDQFKRFGNGFPDGFDGRVFRQVDDAVAAHALSASAEPIAPRGFVCDEPGTPGEWSKSKIKALCAAVVTQGRFRGQLIQLAHDQDTKPAIIYRGLEPIAPIERDERAEFELACSDGRVADIGFKTGVVYESMKANDIWIGWLARAALERKPS
ncbi:hypothetical protein [Pseudomonas monteilii]|uniref:hypothetical protein n=1 Tax=Pseudomonas monteilii TaxID=76759 RepID=UPI000B21BEDE